MIESCETSVSTDEIIRFSKIYNVDIRELLMEEFSDLDEMERISNEYVDLIIIFNQLSSKEKYDIYQILKKWVEEKQR